MTLSVVTQIAPGDNLITFAKMLDSVNFADNITVYTMEMKGNKELEKLKKKHNLNLIHIKTPTVVEHIRSRQVKEATRAWVLVMDFDELIPSELKEEIQTITSTSSGLVAFKIARTNFSLGYPLKHGGWGTDYVIRLFKREQFLDWPTDIHSTPTFNGELGVLKNSMEHHKDQSLEYIVNKTNRYTDKEADQYYKGGMAEVTSFTLLRKLKMEMIRRGIFKGGLLDGKIGLIQSIYQGFSVFTSYAKLYEKQKNSL